MPTSRRPHFRPMMAYEKVGGRLVQIEPSADLGPSSAKPERPPGRRSGMACRLLVPSAALAEVVGPAPLSRTAAVSAFWRYVTEQNLQDPLDRRIILADHKLHLVFGKDRASMFEVGRLLSANLTGAEGDGGAAARPREVVEAGAGEA